MLKKISALFIIFSLIFCFAGCGEKQPEKNSLDLVPYLGGYKCDAENGYWKERLYGLMTTDGRKVTEPIYNDYTVFEKDGKTYYCLKVTEGYWEPISHNSLLASSDGTFRLELQDNIVSLSENRIICQQFEQPFTVYDYSGNKIYSGNECQTVNTDGNGFYNGLLVVYDFLSEDNYMEVRDENGNIVFDRFDYCGPFITNKAVASYNRDDGYGIISADGKWLLDPVYDDIKTVDGKYFIAVKEGREYIYDTNVKLLRERECGVSVTDMSYFFEVNGKLIRQYSHMDSPDQFFRDAFTDEIISCNGINATSFSESLKCFYTVDEASRTAVMCDENGKQLINSRNVDRIEDFDGTYCTTDAITGTCTYYNATTHKKLITLNCNKNEWKPVTTADDCGLLTIADLENKSDNFYDGPYHLYDYKNNKYVFENCEYCEINKIDGNVYVWVVFADRIEVYDAALNLIVKTENAY